jgi:hypothetical protein
MLPQKYGIYQAFKQISTVLVQGGMLTISRKESNPKDLYKIMKLFRAVGSSKRQTNGRCSKANPLYALAIKSKLAMTDTDYRTDTREEQHTEITLILLGFCLLYG